MTDQLAAELAALLLLLLSVLFDTKQIGTETSFRKSHRLCHHCVAFARVSVFSVFVLIKLLNDAFIHSFSPVLFDTGVRIGLVHL